MTSYSPKYLLLSGVLILALSPIGISSAAELKNGPVKRGTKVEELKTQMGEPREVKASQGEGARVEEWLYADGVVVVVQNGFVIDSFVEHK
jgi:hypothetical protein